MVILADRAMCIIEEMGVLSSVIANSFRYLRAKILHKWNVA